MIEKTVQRTRITLRQLEVFSAIAQAGSTRAAASWVARSQSAASTALAELEELLGAPVFDRVGRRLVLNDQGRLILPAVMDVLQRAGELESMLGAEPVGALRLAASFTIGEYLLPTLISDWKQLHPQGSVQLDIVNTRHVLEAVAGFSVDLGFIEGGDTHPDLLVEHWMDDELIIFAAPSHPLLQQRITEASLSEASWIMRERGSGTRETTDRLLLPVLGRLSIAMELGSNEAVKRAVASGLGLGCLSRLAVHEAIKQGDLVELATPVPPLMRSFAMVRHKNRSLGMATDAFFKLCSNLPRSNTNTAPPQS